MLLNISLGALAVVLGALGNHLSLQNIDSKSITSFEIAQRYHMFHVLVGLIEGLMIDFGNKELLIKTSMCFFILGVLFFCGSLYTFFFFRVDFLTNFGAQNHEKSNQNPPRNGEKNHLDAAFVFHTILATDFLSLSWNCH